MDEQTAVEILEKRRKGDRDRFKKWQENQLKQGKKHLSCMISGEAHALLIAEREKDNATTPQIIERALFGQYGDSMVDIVLDDNGQDETPAIAECDIKENQPELFDTDTAPDDKPTPDEHDGLVVNIGIPDYHGERLTTEKGYQVLLDLKEKYPKRTDAKKRLAILNKAGLIYGKSSLPWTKTSASDGFYQAKKWKEKQ